MCKRFFSKILMLVSLFLLFAVMQKTEASAETFDDARDVSVNTEIQDNVTKGHYQEMKYYRFTVEKDGYIHFQFKNPKQKDSNIYWTFRFYNSEYKELCNSVNIKGNVEETNLPCIGIAAGTYYFEVNSCDGNVASSTDIYTIKAIYTESDAWEKEFNNEFLTANPIDLNKEYYGVTSQGHYSGWDYYKFTTEKDGYVTIHFTNPLQGSQGEYWTVRLYNNSYSEMGSMNIHGNVTDTDFVTFGIAAGTYYISVNSCNGSAASSTDIYSIKAVYTESDAWEKEFNNEFLTANPIVLNKEYYGVTSQGFYNEIDTFKITLESSGFYTFDMLTPKMGDSNPYWYMDLHDASYNKIESISIYGNETKHSIKKLFNAGVYYIKVNSHNGSTALSTLPYRIKVSAAESPKDPDSESVLKQGQKIRDESSNAVYTILSISGRTVAYTKPLNTNAGAVVIPSYIDINGNKYKVVGIGAGAFKGNKTVTKIKMESNIENIGKNAFYGCSRLKSVNIGINVTAIGEGAFHKCTSLAKVTIPLNVSKIGKSAFYGCKKLKNITVNSEKLTLKKVGAKAFAKIHKTAKIKVPASKRGAYKKLFRARGLNGKKQKVK